jgi:hypothetical protein
VYIHHSNKGYGKIDVLKEFAPFHLKEELIAKSRNNLRFNKGLNPTE